MDVHRLPVGHRRGKILRYLWEYNAFFVLASIKVARMHARARFAAVQVNIRGGRLPEPEDNGVSYIKIPVNAV